MRTQQFAGWGVSHAWFSFFTPNYCSEWEVSGGVLETLISRFDMENPEAVLHVHRRLEQAGTLDELRRRGVKEGDLVHVGEIAFAFEE